MVFVGPAGGADWSSCHESPRMVASIVARKTQGYGD
jgi:hypothetical protein